MKTKDLMSRSVVTVDRHASLADVARAMLDERIGCVVVVDDQQKLRGIVTETAFAAKERGVPFSLLMLPQLYNDAMPREAVERVRREARATSAEEVMISAVVTAEEETPVEAVAREMLRHDIDHVPVVRDGVPVGMVSRHDFLRLVLGDVARA